MPPKAEKGRVFWTNTSVVGFAGDENPVETMERRSNAAVLDAIEQGWSGPPFDPLALANLLGIEVVPNEAVRDARLVPDRGRVRIEFNPNQPRARARYSIAHEIAHTLFPDHRQNVRNRLAKAEMVADEWQLEMLCNIGAAEILMPTGSFPESVDTDFSIESILFLRDRFEVSTEAVLLRLVKLAYSAAGMFAASFDDRQGRYRLDYSRLTDDWLTGLGSGLLLPEDSCVSKCTAIGYTAKGDEEWSTDLGRMHVECVALAPYPGQSRPRVVGSITPKGVRKKEALRIEYLVGDATSPHAEGRKIIAHVVNDGAARWGAGFAKVIRTKWPSVQKAFIDWASADRLRLKLGNSQLERVDENLWVCQMISQKGYGESKRPRIRYGALETCLQELGDMASERSASVHMPRIGCGQAGGNWAVVRELIETSLCRRGIKVFVYDLPSERKRWTEQSSQLSMFSV